MPTDLSTLDLLNMDDLQMLALNGWWIGTHGPDHSYLASASSLKNTANILEQDCRIIKQRGWTPWFAWPEGSWCGRTADIIARLEDGPTAQFGLSNLPKGEGRHQQSSRE